MTPLPTTAFWLHSIGLVAAEAALVIGLAATLQRCARSIYWRRAIWQIATLSLMLLLLVESTGLGRACTRWMIRPVRGHWGVSTGSEVAAQPADPLAGLKLEDAFLAKVRERIAFNRENRSR